MVLSVMHHSNVCHRCVFHTCIPNVESVALLCAVVDVSFVASKPSPCRQNSCMSLQGIVCVWVCCVLCVVQECRSASCACGRRQSIMPVVDVVNKTACTTG